MASSAPDTSVNSDPSGPAGAPDSFGGDGLDGGTRPGGSVEDVPPPIEQPMPDEDQPMPPEDQPMPPIEEPPATDIPAVPGWGGDN